MALCISEEDNEGQRSPRRSVRGPHVCQIVRRRIRIHGPSSNKAQARRGGQDRFARADHPGVIGRGRMAETLVRAGKDLQRSGDIEELDGGKRQDLHRAGDRLSGRGWRKSRGLWHFSQSLSDYIVAVQSGDNP